MPHLPGTNVCDTPLPGTHLTRLAVLPTPHIKCEEGAFAKTVLMPGDPLRAKFIAETFLEDAVLVNNVRGVNGYTGYYTCKDGHKKRVSVMASGMGMPSIGIYSYELFTACGVESIIRIGSAGSLNPKVKIMDVVIAQGCCTNSNFNNQYNLPGNYAPLSDINLLLGAIDNAKAAGLKDGSAPREGNGPAYHVGNVLSADTFYDDHHSPLEWSKIGALCVEMEGAALMGVASRLGKKATCICTISDSVIGEDREDLTADERQLALTDMIKIALETAEE